MSAADESVVDYDDHDPSTTADADEKSRKRTRDASNDSTDCDESQKLSRGEQDTSASRASSAGASIDPSDVSSFSSANGLILVERSEGNLSYEIIPEKVGHIIGSKGMIILDIIKRSGAKVLVNQDFPKGVNRKITINGTEEQMVAAADLIKRIVDFGPTAIHENSLEGGPHTTMMIECSQAQVGKVIGGGGANIKEIQSQSGAKVQVEQDFPPEVPRQIHIAGTQKAVEAAERLVRNILAQTSGIVNLAPNQQERGQGFARNAGGFGGQMGGHQGGAGYGQQGGRGGQQGGGGYAAAGPASGGPEVQNSMDVPKSMVGKVMGKGAETLHLIQRRSSCRVNIDQNVPEGAPCKVNITGSQHNVGIAIGLVQELLSGVHYSKIGQNLPQPAGGNAGGFPSAGGYPGGGGGGGGAGGYNMPAYGGAMPGYGMAPAMSAPGYGGYGGFSNPMYNSNPYPMGGGYQSYGAAAGGAAGGYGGAFPGAGAGPSAGYGGGYGGGGYGGAQAHHGGGHGGGHAGAAPSKSKWTEHKTDDGISYWYNSASGQSQVSSMIIQHFVFLLDVNFVLFCVT